MKKAAIFGKPGSGKSLLAKHLAERLQIPLYPLDLIAYQQDGTEVSLDEYTQAHQKILEKDIWIIDGLGAIPSFYQRLDAADTLIYIDLPYPTSYWFVTKRFFKGFFVRPEGWPKGSSILKGSIQSFKTLKLCPKFWNSTFLTKLEAIAEHKTLVVIKSREQLDEFIELYKP